MKKGIRKFVGERRDHVDQPEYDLVTWVLFIFTNSIDFCKRLSSTVFSLMAIDQSLDLVFRLSGAAGPDGAKSYHLQ